MIRQPDRLAQHPFDLLVIGGGILGAGIARDAALRGLSVALVEQGDFVSGTSSKTTKLIHGGLRYLEQFDLGLVRESCRERRTLLTLAPHLVKPLPFIIPVYRDGPRPAWKVRLGVALYDRLAGRAALGPHHFYGSARAHDLEPQLPGDRISGAVEYADAQMDDVRLCLETLFDAAEHGAVAVNYAKVVRFHAQHDRVASASGSATTGRRLVTGAEVESLAGPGSWLAQAKVIVNAAGPWADTVRRLADPQATNIVRRSKGIHIVYPKLPLTRAVVLSAHRDGRIYFVIPWRGWSLIGTTDTDDDAAPEKARATAEDVAYLLEETNQLLPGLGLAKERIVTTFAGVRPLAAGRDGDRVPWQMSRTHRLHEDPNGLLSIVGGKYTTYRAIAEEVVDRVVRRLGRAPIACRTAEAPLAAVRGAGPPGTASLCPHHAFTPADVRRAVEQEAAITLSDVLWRRLEVAWAPCQGLDCADAATRVMAESLGWDAVGIHRQVETYRAEVLANHVP